MQEVNVVLFRMSECPIDRLEEMTDVLGEEKERLENVQDAIVTSLE